MARRSTSTSIPSTPLLWVIREQVGLTGTKYGCGVAQCGACTVHVDGAAIRSCVMPVAAVEGKKITTIEGLAAGGTLHKVQQAWLEHEVPQCGYCQSGMIMAVAALLQDEAEAHRRRHRRGHHQHLPLRHVPAGARGHPRRGEGMRGSAMIAKAPKIDRRSFIVGTAAVGGGLALGLESSVRRAASSARQDGSPEITPGW